MNMNISYPLVRTRTIDIIGSINIVHAAWYWCDMMHPNGSCLFWTEWGAIQFSSRCDTISLQEAVLLL